MLALLVSFTPVISYPTSHSFHMLDLQENANERVNIAEDAFIAGVNVCLIETLKSVGIECMQFIPIVERRADGEKLAGPAN